MISNGQCFSGFEFSDTTRCRTLLQVEPEATETPPLTAIERLIALTGIDPRRCPCCKRGRTLRGATFSAPVIVNDASIIGTSPGNIQVEPAVGPNGEVYVGWWTIP